MNATTELRMTSEKMPVGKGFAVVFTMAGGQLDVEWLPRMPGPRRGRQCLPSYRLARNEFLRRVALKTGLNVMVVEA
ncbi:hypothetical protein [Sphingomonas sp. Leaf25]|uniref:hypothetical protein n=1 Tax=Sphingomonas sp. Leaf25 TaxID=1735692 RepID=UPI000B07A5B6|nr:hypothetical protein [Sphingomonas sp. Leaf25]